MELGVGMHDNKSLVFLLNRLKFNKTHLRIGVIQICLMISKETVIQEILYIYCRHKTYVSIINTYPLFFRLTEHTVAQLVEALR
jgi:hypothetical protein